MKILLTGGAGFIGSTVASACADAGLRPVILDDLSSGVRAFGERFTFYEGDYGDARLLRRVFAEHPDIGVVAHFAAKIIVPESMAKPLDYYANNVSRLPTLLAEMLRAGCTRMVFSSTAAMYEPGPSLVVDEGSHIRPLSPYAASKWMAERILADTTAATELAVISLRYFNPVGADPQLRSGLQVPNPTHALGMLMRASEAGEPFAVTGTDWPTRDGSGIRDFIHVWDLASAHVAALSGFDKVVAAAAQPGFEVINLGTGTGTTVFELVDAFRRTTGQPLDVIAAPRRAGDVVGCYTSAEKAAAILGWRARLSLEQAIAHSMAWRHHLGAQGICRS